MPVLLTLQAIKANYPSNKEQIEGAKIALKILENTPNEKIKNQLTEILSSGHLEN